MDLVKRCTTSSDLHERLSDLREEARNACHACSSYASLTSLMAWYSSKREWWFDSDYLEVDIEPIRTYFEAIERYTLLPRDRGTGHAIERWVRTENIEEAHESAEETFRKLLEGNR
jgi:hypothetical protein